MTEVPLTTWQFLQLTFVLGAPVHAALVIFATLLLRSRHRTDWGKLLLLAPVLLASSIALQAIMWTALPDLPEPFFMMLGFVNGPAVFGAIPILAALLIVGARRQPSGLA